MKVKSFLDLGPRSQAAQCSYFSYFFLFFPSFLYSPVFLTNLLYFPIFLKNAENQPWKSCFHRNLQHLTMSFWGPSGPQTPAGMRSLIFVSQHIMLFLHRVPYRIFSLYIKGTKKLRLCLNVLISLFQVKCTFFMVFTDIRSPL